MINTSRQHHHEYLRELLRDDFQRHHCSYMAMPELGLFSNHAPMALVAIDRLARLGGIESSYKIEQLLRAFYDKYSKTLWPLDEHVKPGVVMTDSNWREFIGQDECYSHFIHRFQKLVEEKRAGGGGGGKHTERAEIDLANELLQDESANLIAGIAGSAFHPIIHTAYGLLQEDCDVVISGLAYLAAANAAMTTNDERRHTGLHGFLWKDPAAAAAAAAATEHESSSSPRQQTYETGQVSGGKTFMYRFLEKLSQQLPDSVKKEGQELRRERMPLIKMFRKVAHLQDTTIEMIHHLIIENYDQNDSDFPAQVIAQVAHFALKLLLKTGPTDILTLHAVTATHAARIISRGLVPENQRRLAVHLWESFAIICLLYEFDSLLFDEDQLQFPDEFEDRPWREICLQAARRKDVHDLKLVYTAFEEAHHYDNDDIMYKAIAVMRLRETEPSLTED